MTNALIGDQVQPGEAVIAPLMAICAPAALVRIDELIGELWVLDEHIPELRNRGVVGYEAHRCVEATLDLDELRLEI